MTWTKNKITGLVGLIFASTYIFFSTQIKQPSGMMTQDVLGSRTFPIALGVIMLISSIVIMFQGKSEEDEDSLGKEEFIKLLPYVLAVIVYIALLPILGTIIATTLFMYFVMEKMNKGKWWKNLLIIVPIALIFWILFDVILKVSLPTGLLGVI